MLRKKYSKLLLIGMLCALPSLYSFVSSNYFEMTKNLEIFASIIKELNTYYVDDIEPKKIIRTGMDAMLKSLDPYNNFIPEEEMAGFKLQTTGRYGGIGAIIRSDDDYVVISEPYEGFPAQKADLRAGDKIVKIAGKSAKGKTTEDVSKLLKGRPNTSIQVTIERPGQGELLKTLTRQEIKVKSVPYYGMLNNETGYILLTNFTEKCAKEVKDALKKLKKEHKAKSVVLDLRNNPGGLLNESINVANVFLKKGQTVVSTKGREDEDKNYRTKSAPTDLDIPLVILIDRGSASASEIVSGVIQDLDRGIVIGQRSYGKGLVQTTKGIGYNAKVKMTTSKYYLPSGRCIQAIDYSGGYSDKLAKVPDSLRTSFKTTSGRKVYDSGGVDPDVELEEFKYNNIMVNLINKDLIFDYATQYRNKNSSLAKPKDFELNDNDFKQFVQFVKTKKYDYTSKSEKLLEELKKSIKKEQYEQATSSEMAELESKIKNNKEQDLQKHKEEITNALESNIASRYYFQKGKVEETVEEDKMVQKAVEILSNPTEYQRILKAR